MAGSNYLIYRSKFPQSFPAQHTVDDADVSVRPDIRDASLRVTPVAELNEGGKERRKEGRKEGSSGGRRREEEEAFRRRTFPSARVALKQACCCCD